MKKKQTKPIKPAGVMRNDLEGSMRVRGKKISIRYKQKEFATGYENTPIGWKLANDWWAIKLKDLQAIQAGEKQVEDTIQNIFNQFLEYKRTIDKISHRTTEWYLLGFKSIFTTPNLILSHTNIVNSIEKFLKTTAVSKKSINIYLGACASFLNWCADDDRKYIQKSDYFKKYKQKERKIVKPAFTEEEYNMFLEHFATSNYEMFLLIQFLWLTGARCGEALLIRLMDIDLQNNRIKMVNKVHKGVQELLLLTDEAVVICEKIVKFAKERADKKLFSWSDFRQPNRILLRAETKLGSKKSGRGLHGFRRSFTHKLIKAGVSVPIIQDAVRHKSIETTMKYYNEYRPDEIIDTLNKKL